MKIKDYIKNKNRIVNLQVVIIMMRIKKIKIKMSRVKKWNSRNSKRCWDSRCNFPDDVGHVILHPLSVSEQCMLKITHSNFEGLFPAYNLFLSNQKAKRHTKRESQRERQRTRCIHYSVFPINVHQFSFI